MVDSCTLLLVTVGQYRQFEITSQRSLVRLNQYL
jgi:hypothetical protein